MRRCYQSYLARAFGNSLLDFYSLHARAREVTTVTMPETLT
jgi:hypothetical protein